MQLRIKVEPGCNDGNPQVNSSGIVDIKPALERQEQIENLKLEYVQDNSCSVETSTVVPEKTFKIEPTPTIKTEDAPVMKLECDSTGDTRTNEMTRITGINTAEKMSEIQEPIVITPQCNSSETFPHEKLEDVPSTLFQGTLIDPTLGSVSVDVKITPEFGEYLTKENCGHIFSNSADGNISDQHKDVWPKYTSRKDISKQTSIVKVKPCFVKLKRLRLTPELINQLFIYKQKLKKAKRKKPWRQKNRAKRLTYECSSSEDEDFDTSREDPVSDILIKLSKGSSPSTTKLAYQRTTELNATSNQPLITDVLNNSDRSSTKKPVYQKLGERNAASEQPVELDSYFLSEQSSQDNISECSRNQGNADRNLMSSTNDIAQNSEGNKCDFEDYLLD